MQPIKLALAKASTVCYNSHRYIGIVMTQLYLIRHAHTRMTGGAAERWPLSEKGRREARILARQDFWRKVELIFSSPEPKASSTAKPAARRWGVPLRIVDCLRELHRPRLIPDYRKAIARLFANPEQSIAGMETAAQAAGRITHCIRELVAAHPGQTLAVVSHGLVLTLFLAQLDDRWPTTSEWRAVPFAGLITVDTNTWHPIENWLRISETP
jgi:broad specificity phosphatase PhoE